MKTYNILIVGKSGVGKSSLLNYIFDKDIAKTGSGKPQTEKGFHHFESYIDDLKLNIYDSWGLEAGKSNEWINEFNKFQDDKRNEKDVTKWIHTVIYCFSGEGKRIEDFEIDIVKTLENELLSPVIVVTKADAKNSEILSNEIKKVLNIEPIRVCNINSNIIWGDVVNNKLQFGRKEIISGIKSSAVNSFNSRAKFLFENKLKKAELNLDEKIFKKIKFLLKSKAIKEKVSKRDLKDIEISLKDIVNKEKAMFENEYNEYQRQAKEFYENDIFLNFTNFIDKEIDMELDISPDFPNSFDFFDIFNIFFMPLTFLLSFFENDIQKDDRKIYPIKKVLEEFKIKYTKKRAMLLLN